ncbi:histidinol-phosphate transaminase [Ferrimonas senticii]|uniref:histidinol-phosphate transaminase n=1 Tax=Ferrimonas senticii TaxID=394566 RepID=UPI00040EE1FB|nr:histidinol-phosphate transaminase [Ferrimonas senticii]
MSLVSRLARSEMLALVPYSSARREFSGGSLFLNANESPWNNTDVVNANRYPDCQPPQLRQQYATFAGVNPEQVLITRGADEGIDLLFRAFCRPGVDAVGCLTPSYGMYAISAATNAVECRQIPWTAEYQLPTDFAEQNQLDSKPSKLVFVCNPNNPTGTVISVAAIAELAAKLPDSLLVVDEAYIEFAPELSAVSLLEQFDNLVILRTLSKAFALAGARCGFVLASSEIIALLEKVIAPYPVPEPTAQLAIAATSDNGITTMTAQVAELNRQRRRLVIALDELDGVGSVLDSHANFVLFACRQSEQVHQTLAADGLLIRRYQADNLQGWLRASIGSDRQISTLISALQAALAQFAPTTQKDAV